MALDGAGQTPTGERASGETGKRKHRAGSEPGPRLSIVVPALNSGANLQVLLESLTAQHYDDFEVIVNDDQRTSDDTAMVIDEFRLRGLTILHILENRSMAQARRTATEYTTGEILVHVDSDMSLSPGVLEECVHLLGEGFDVLVIPEESYGSTFWARCKWLERQCYLGVDEIESARCMPRTIYDEVGGHNPAMVFSEDKDLDVRIRSGGFTVGRTEALIYHNEGALSLRKTVVSKFRYSSSAHLHAQRNPEAFRWQSSPIARFQVFWDQRRLLLRHPVLSAGMLLMKLAEYLGIVVGLSYWRIKSLF